MIPKVRSETPSAISQFQRVSCSGVRNWSSIPEKYDIWKFSVSEIVCPLGGSMFKTMEQEGISSCQHEKPTCCDLYPAPALSSSCGRKEDRMPGSTHSRDRIANVRPGIERIVCSGNEMRCELFNQTEWIRPISPDFPTNTFARNV
jgi:hypothetical protein